MEDWEATGKSLDDALDALKRAAPFVARVRGLGISVDRALRLLQASTVLVLDVEDTDKAISQVTLALRREQPAS